MYLEVFLFILLLFILLKFFKTENQELFKKIKKHKEKLITLIVFLAIYGFLLYYFKPSLLLMKTTIAGGDTASHYYPAKYMKEYLLPNGQIKGWNLGWFAGFPMFEFYFFPLFVLASLLGKIVGLEVGVKLVTVLGTFLLPPAVYIFLRKLNFSLERSVAGAVFSLFFLFMQANSMWGGNIPSTLAGEFSYSFSMAAAFIYLGFLWKGVKEDKYILVNSLLFAIVLLTHIYGALFAGFSSLFFLTQKNYKKNLFYLFKIYFLAFLLTAFWSIPFVLNLKYTTAYADFWNVGFEKVFPQPLNLFLLISGLLLFKKIKKDPRFQFVLFSIASAFILFYLAEPLGLVNIRFAGFIQLTVCILAGVGFGYLIKKRNKHIAVLILSILTILAANHYVTFIDDWISWNYKGFELKDTWNDYKEINDFLKGDFSDPRVVYEHNDKNNNFGTLRAFESLPLFAGRATLEGLYIQSSPTTPFIFYIQSEMSKQQSCPFWKNYECTHTNIKNGTQHLKLFNVKHFIAVTPEVKDELKDNDEWISLKTVGDYEIFELKTNPNKYVTIPENYPVVYSGKNWKSFSYEWFKDMNIIDTPVIFSNDNLPYQKVRSLEEIKKIKINQKCKVWEKIENEKISFDTNCIGIPHIISISYYPKWHVTGADKIYLVSPSFMLVIPEKEHVELIYKDNLIDRFSNLASLVGLFLIFYIIIKKKSMSY